MRDASAINLFPPHSFSFIASLDVKDSTRIDSLFLEGFFRFHFSDPTLTRESLSLFETRVHVWTRDSRSGIRRSCVRLLNPNPGSNYTSSLMSRVSLCLCWRK